MKALWYHGNVHKIDRDKKEPRVWVYFVCGDREVHRQVHKHALQISVPMGRPNSYM